MGQKKNMCDFPHILAKTMRHVVFHHLMSLKHGSDSPETSHDPAYECTTVEGREPRMSPCSQAMNPFCSCFALITHPSPENLLTLHAYYHFCPKRASHVGEKMVVPIPV